MMGHLDLSLYGKLMAKY